jgi:hypothetical protein
MKFLLMSAVALAFAAPTVAHATSHAEAHQGHGQHHAHPAGAQPADHAGHAGHAQHQHAASGAMDHSKHADCCGDAEGKGKMDCCEGDQASQRPCCAKHAGHKQAKAAPAK